MMSLWDALRMNMMISYQELVRTFPKCTTVTFTSWRAENKNSPANQITSAGHYEKENY